MAATGRDGPIGGWLPHWHSSRTVGHGVLYYAFAVLLTSMAATLHASTAAVTGAMTASVLAGAAMGAGRPAATAVLCGHVGTRPVRW